MWLFKYREEKSGNECRECREPFLLRTPAAQFSSGQQSEVDEKLLEAVVQRFRRAVYPPIIDAEAVNVIDGVRLHAEPTARFSSDQKLANTRFVHGSFRSSRGSDFHSY
jgi:hypothetical protein